MPTEPGRFGWLTAQAYAHRGLHDGNLPENSLGAFRAAIEAGLGIECDVRRSADGRAIVFHDEELERLTGRAGRLSQHSVGELTDMAIGMSGERVPTLRDALDLVDGRAPLLIELKTSRERPVTPLCRAVRRDLEGYCGPAAVMSFDPRVGHWFAGHAAHVARGLVVTEEDARTLAGALRRRLSVRRARPHFLAYDIRDLPSAFAASQAKRGLALLSWTVRSSAQLETAQAAGATPILEAAGVAAWSART